MANINIIRTHQFSAEEIRAKIDGLMDSLKSELNFNSEWENPNEFVFRRKGANGQILIDESSFELNLNLGLMYSILKSSIEKIIISTLDKQFS